VARVKAGKTVAVG